MVRYLRRHVLAVLIGVVLVAAMAWAAGRVMRTEISSSWYEGDELVEWVTEREEGESYWALAVRHNQEVAEVKAAAPQQREK